MSLCFTIGGPLLTFSEQSSPATVFSGDLTRWASRDANSLSFLNFARLYLSPCFTIGGRLLTSSESGFGFWVMPCCSAHFSDTSLPPLLHHQENHVGKDTDRREALHPSSRRRITSSKAAESVRWRRNRKVQGLGFSSQGSVKCSPLRSRDRRGVSIDGANLRASHLGTALFSAATNADLFLTR